MVFFYAYYVDKSVIFSCFGVLMKNNIFKEIKYVQEV